MARDAVKKRNYNKAWHKKNLTYRKDRRLQKDYGITLADYNEFSTFCQHKCAICDKPETAIHPQSQQIQVLSVDHDHKLGHIRGLLCAKCNSALGLLGDSVETLKSALNYLQSYKETLEEQNAVKTGQQSEDIRA